LVGQQIPVTRIGLADLLDSDIDWEAVDFELRARCHFCPSWRPCGQLVVSPERSAT